MWQRDAVIIVVATSAEQVAATSDRVRAGGADELAVIAPGGARQLVLGSVDDAASAELLALQLRDEGILAMARPDHGPRLAAWREHTAPVRFGDRLSVCFAWSEHERGDLPGLIELGAGGWGNGSHPTTGMLVEQLLQRLSGDERVLDVGCGSGVLGLAALRLGAAQVVAVDLKPAAVEAAARNAALNGMEQRIVVTSAPLETIAGTFDAIVANVGRAAVVELAPELIGLLAQDGWLAVSGISPPQCSLVAGFLHPLVEAEQRTSGEWSAIVLRRG